MTLVGSRDNPFYDQAARRLREFRARYAPLVRLFLIAVSGCGASTDFSTSAHFTSAQPAFSIQGEVVLETLADDAALQRLQRYLDWVFLGRKAALLAGRPTAQLAIRPYIHEALRTASFLVVHSPSRRCVAVDPTASVCDAIRCDVQTEGLELVAVCITHAFRDVLLGHDVLLASWPSAQLVAGARRQEHSNNGKCIAVSPESPTLGAADVTMSAIPTPAYSDDGLVFLLRIGTVPACYFTGAAWPLDALPRVDLAAAEEHLSFDEALGRAYKTLVMLRRVIFGSPEACPAAEVGDPIVFPSHGGYNNVSNQLDLHWAAPVSALARMQHTRRLLAALDSFEAYKQQMTEAPPLPDISLFRLLRWLNRCRTEDSTRQPDSTQSPTTAAIVGSPPLIDLRSVDEYCARHVRGAANFPMTFPGTSPGAKKAELWLSCFLQVPEFDSEKGPSADVTITVMCSSGQEEPEIRARLRAIGVGVSHRNYQSRLTVLAADTFDWSSSPHMSHSYRSVTEDAREGAAPRWMRLRTYEDLDALTDSPASLVIDCRTPYEFRNGSHGRSVHMPLAALCIAAGTGPLSLSELLRDVLQRAGRRDAAVVRYLSIYCAAGYRSHIAVSLFQMLAERSEGSQGVPVIRDVEGGALRIMTLRPDLWLVKDRSVVCIS